MNINELMDGTVDTTPYHRLNLLPGADLHYFVMRDGVKTEVTLEEYDVIWRAWAMPKRNQ